MDTPPLIEQLSGSESYRDYERAFGEATGLPLALRPVDGRRLGKIRPAKCKACVAPRNARR